jgi:hypothetical protein
MYELSWWMACVDTESEETRNANHHHTIVPIGEDLTLLLPVLYIDGSTAPHSGSSFHVLHPTGGDVAPPSRIPEHVGGGVLATNLTPARLRSLEWHAAGSLARRRHRRPHFGSDPTLFGFTSTLPLRSRLRRTRCNYVIDWLIDRFAIRSPTRWTQSLISVFWRPLCFLLLLSVICGDNAITRRHTRTWQLLHYYHTFLHSHDNYCALLATFRLRIELFGVFIIGER